jgi:hypothetical protein
VVNAGASAERDSRAGEPLNPYTGCAFGAPLDSLVRVGRTRHENWRVRHFAAARERRQFPLQQLRQVSLRDHPTRPIDRQRSHVAEWASAAEVGKAAQKPPFGVRAASLPDQYKCASQLMCRGFRGTVSCIRDLAAPELQPPTLRLQLFLAIDVDTENPLILLVPPAGFEPTAPGLGILCSIHLS